MGNWWKKAFSQMKRVNIPQASYFMLDPTNFSGTLYYYWIGCLVYEWTSWHMVDHVLELESALHESQNEMS